MKNFETIVCIEKRHGVNGGKLGEQYYKDTNSVCMIEGSEFAEFYFKEDDEYYYLGFFKTKRFSNILPNGWAWV